MSLDEKLEKRRKRAEEDVREAHRNVRRLVQRFAADPESWKRSIGNGWSPAETLLHLAMVGGVVADALRVCAAAGPVQRDRTRSVQQAAALRLLLTTWRHPSGPPPLAGTDPQGRLESPDLVAGHHVAWASGFVALLRDHSGPYLAGVMSKHPKYGDLDAFEWARWMRIYFRYHELRMSVRTG
ncbi:MAG: hypothetical protein CL910_09920 [Deltaproteobacteria bacterium]|jgi:hypothetical protein|nr:hypothetical protein [Deltaproteobacteria bacterium]